MSSNTTSASAGAGAGQKTMKELLLSHVARDAEPSGRAHKKVTIVGAGAVGLAAAYSILNQGITSELALVDVSLLCAIADAVSRN
jgi:NADPH-dependent 2,4-dienoyl-CoA reductase/sulfur reductase-like enzyme